MGGGSIAKVGARLGNPCSWGNPHPVMGTARGYWCVEALLSIYRGYYCRGH